MRCAEGGCASSPERDVVGSSRALPRKRAEVVALTLLSILLWPAHRLAAQTADEVQAAADGAIRRLGLQTEFPHGPEPLNFHLDLPPETLWVVVAIAVAILLYAFRDTLTAWRRGGAGAWAEEAGELDATKPSSEALVLEAADELATAGRFVEAMHVLLLQGVGHIRRRQELSDSLTSREILRSTELPEAARAALRDVITRVELTYFGKQPAALPDYTACRQSFHALAQALYGSGA
jgi:hypothetical protein